MSVASLQLSDLAATVGGEIIRGEPTLALTGMAALDTAGPGDVSFLGNEKYSHQFETTNAAAVIVAYGVTNGPKTAALIAVENPTLAFSAVVRHFAEKLRTFQPSIHERAFVHPEAKLDPTTVCIHAGAIIMAGAEIGAHCEIGPNAIIGENARLGENCHVMANAVVRERCVLGNRVHLQPGAVIGSDGFGYQFSDGKHVKIEQLGIVEIHDDVEVGANTTIDRARFGKTIIGEGTKIDNLVQIGHNVVIGKHCLIVALTGIAGSTKIGNHCTFAGQVGIIGHLTIGDKILLAARSGVSSNLPEPGAYSGNPVMPLREEQKLRVLARRLPKLIERVEKLETRMGNSEG